MDVSGKDGTTSTDTSTDMGEPFAHPGISLPANASPSPLTFDIDSLKIKEQFQASGQHSENSIPDVSSGLPIGELVHEDTNHHIMDESNILWSSMTNVPLQQLETIQNEEPETDKVNVTDPCDETKSVTANILDIALDRSIDDCSGSAPQSLGSDSEDMKGNITIEMLPGITNFEPEHTLDVEKNLKISSGFQTNEQADKVIQVCTGSSTYHEVKTSPMGNIEGSVPVEYEANTGQCDSAVGEFSDRSLGLEEKVPSFLKETVDRSEDLINHNTFQHMEEMPAEGQLPAPSFILMESEVSDAVIDEALNLQIMDKQDCSVDRTEGNMKQESLLGKNIDDAASFEHVSLLSNETREVPSSLPDSCTQEIGVVVTKMVEGTDLPALDHELPKASETEAQYLESLEASQKLASQFTDVPGKPKDGSIEGGKVCAEVLISEISNEANKIDDVDKVDGDAKHGNVEGDFAHMKGKKVCKSFGRKKYMGEVVEYDATAGWFKVLYEDGDEEDLERGELDAILFSPDSTPHTVSRKRPLSSVVSKGKSERSKARKYGSASTPRGGKKSTPSKSLKKSSQKKKSGPSVTSTPRSKKTPTSASKRKVKPGSSHSVKKSDKSSRNVSLTPASKRKEKSQRTRSIKTLEKSSRKGSSMLKSATDGEKSNHTPKRLKFGSVKVGFKKQKSVKNDRTKQQRAEKEKNLEAANTPATEVRASKRGRSIVNDPSSSIGQKSKKQTRVENDRISEAAVTPVTEVKTNKRGRSIVNDPSSSTGRKSKKQTRVENDRISAAAVTPLAEVKTSRRGRKLANDLNSGTGEKGMKQRRVESRKKSEAADTPLAKVRTARRGTKPANDPNDGTVHKAKKQEGGKKSAAAAADTPVTEARTTRRGTKLANEPNSGTGQKAKEQKRGESNKKSEITPVIEVRTSRRGSKSINDLNIDKKTAVVDTPVTEVRTSRRGSKTVNDPNIDKKSALVDNPVIEVKTSKRGRKPADDPKSQKAKKQNRVERSKNAEAGGTPVTEVRTTRKGTEPTNVPSGGVGQEAKKRKRVENDKNSGVEDTPITEVRTSRSGRKKEGDPKSSMSQKPKGKESGSRKDGKTALIGNKVKKEFGGVVYSGEVVGYTKFYKVLYEDGDREDLTWKELEPILVSVDMDSLPARRKH